MYLVHLGHSTFNKDWVLTSFKVKSAYSFDNKIFELYSLPPANIFADNTKNFINSAYLSSMVNAVYLHYEDLNFSHLSWMYWHALCSPIHAAPIHFGAAIEALQASYLDKHKLPITKLLDEANATNLKHKLNESIKALPIEEDIRNILLNKVGEFNKPPQNMIAERLFEHLKLKLGPQEKKAWSHRNDAGHGKQIKEENFIEVIKDTKLLKIRFHRMFLSMTNANNIYHDDYTEGHLFRNLSDPAA